MCTKMCLQNLAVYWTQHDAAYVASIHGWVKHNTTSLLLGAYIYLEYVVPELDFIFSWQGTPQNLCLAWHMELSTCVCIPAGWCMGLFRWVQPYQHWGAVSGGPTDPLHPSSSWQRSQEVRLWRPGDQAHAHVWHLHHHEPRWVGCSSNLWAAFLQVTILWECTHAESLSTIQIGHHWNQKRNHHKMGILGS